MQRVTIVAQMIDGTCIVEHKAGWEAFIAIALSLWHDSECVRLTWHENGRPAGVGERAALRRAEAA